LGLDRMGWPWEGDTAGREQRADGGGMATTGEEVSGVACRQPQIAES
jgi:hypothetical protein